MKHLLLFLIIHFVIVNPSPLSLPQGGSGNFTTTANAVLCLTSTGLIQSLGSAGTSGQALVSAGAASLPAFGVTAISGGGTGTASLSAGIISSNGSVLSSLGNGSSNQVLKNTSAIVGWSFTGLLQLVSASTFDRISTTGTSIANDNSIPQISEGTSILSLAITPKSASSNLFILFSTSGTPATASTTTPPIMALFVDSGVNAVAAQYLCYRSSGSSCSGMLSYIVPSGSTATKTYEVRIGGSDFQVNSGSSSRKFGGVASTYLIIAEIA